MMSCRLSAAHWLLVAIGCFMGAAHAARPPQIDSYKVLVSANGDGTYAVTGLAGSVAPSDQVRITNYRGGATIQVAPLANGSFAGSIGAQPGDPLGVTAVDGDGTAGVALTEYAGGFTIKNPYAISGYWFVGQAHVHTNNSDGVNSPQQMEAAYFDAGYNFVISTDHRGTQPYYPYYDDGLTPDPSNAYFGKDLLWIRGEELGFGSAHLGGWGESLRTSTALGQQGLQAQINTVRKNGGIAVVNHPENAENVYAWDWQTELMATRGYSMVEAFNGKHPPDFEAGAHVVDAVDLADAYRQVWWIGADDCHNKDAFEFNTYAIVVQTDSAVLNQRDALSAADAGRMYIRQTASGPNLRSVRVNGNTIFVKLDDIGSLYDVVWKKRGDQVAETDLAVDTTASYTVRGDEGYIRAEIRRQSDGLFAYTQPLFIANSSDLAVAASSSSGVAPYLVDNDRATFWEAPPGASFIIDLGQERTANAIKIEWDLASDSRFNYRIDASRTGAFAGEQIEVAKTTYGNRSAATLDYFDEYTRYLKVTVTSQSAGSSAPARVREVEVFDASPARTDLYVDNLRGSDANSGLAGSPWRSLLAAKEKVRPRDTLHVVNTGTPYPGNLDVRNSSGAHPGATVRIEGDPSSPTEIDATGLQFGVRFTGAKFLEWAYFDIHSAGDANVWVLSGDKSAVIDSNRIHDGVRRGVLGSQGLTLVNNLVYRNGTDGVFLYQDGTDADIFHNVFYRNYRGVTVTSNAVNANVRDNIFASQTAEALYESSTGTVTDSHNCVAGTYAGRWFRTGNVDSDPRMQNPEAGIFSLRADSPCIDAGIDLGVDLDFVGNARVDVPWSLNRGSPGSGQRNYVDMGAHEYTP